MSNKSILESFPLHLTPREVQKNALVELEKNWSKADVFVVNLPVASGKSAIAMTLAKWQKKASVITPTKLLVNQYKDEYNYVQVLRSKADYYCSTFKCSLNFRPKRKGLPKTCPKTIDCPGCHEYITDLRKSRVMPYLISNYYIYMAHRLYRSTLIVDEAHQLIDMLKNMSRKKLWAFQYKIPSYVIDRKSAKRWVNSLKPEQFNYKFRLDNERTWGQQDILYMLKEEINSKRPRFLIRRIIDKYNGEEQDCLIMEPLDIREEPPFLWPSSVKKIVLMSATISRKDIEQMGLADKKIIYIQADSPITSEKRPVLIPSERKSMAYASQENNLPYLVDFINQAAEHHKTEKGLIHVTYGLAERLKKHIRNPRIIWHNKENKMAKYQEFRDSQTPKILVASGMYEGIDLPYDAGRWQILAKVPYPSLADEAIKFMANLDSEYYAWETIKTVLQACGRICRTPEDYGITYIYDKSFIRLYTENPQFFPLWFQNSVQIDEEEEV